MENKQQQLRDLCSALGYKELNRTWAKIEIALGLSAAALGLFLGHWALSQAWAEVQWALIGGGLILFVLGGYLALAGHRSHLYQSSNELAAYLVHEIRRMKEQG